MKPLAITWVLLVGVVCAVMSFLGFFAHMRAGGTPMIVTPGPGVVFALATAAAVVDDAHVVGGAHGEVPVGQLNVGA